MARGSRAIAGRAPSRDQAGRSLPSDASTQYVELQVVCRTCSRPEHLLVLGAWWIDSRLEAFDAGQVNERANQAMVRQMPDGPEGRQRYAFECPGRCRRKGVLRQDTIDDKLAEAFERDVTQKIVYIDM